MAGYAQRAAEYFAAYPDFHTYTFNFLPKEGQYHAVRMGNDVMIVQLGTLALTIFELAMLPALKAEQKAQEAQKSAKLQAALNQKQNDIGLAPPSPWVNTPRPIAPDRYSSFSTDIDIDNRLFRLQREYWLRVTSFAQETSISCAQ